MLRPGLTYSDTNNYIVQQCRPLADKVRVTSHTPHPTPLHPGRGLRGTWPTPDQTCPTPDNICHNDSISPVSDLYEPVFLNKKHNTVPYIIWRQINPPFRQNKYSLFVLPWVLFIQRIHELLIKLTSLCLHEVACKLELSLIVTCCRKPVRHGESRWFRQ